MQRQNTIPVVTAPEQTDFRSGQSMTCKRYQKHVVVLDRYRTPFRLLLPGNTDQYRTVLGTIFTVLTLSLVLSYATYKLQDLLDLSSDYKLMEESR